MAKYEDYGLSGRVAIITGAGTGIGAACAEELAKGGAKVALFGRRTAPLQQTKDECLKYTDGVLALSVDVSDKASVAGGVKAVLDAFGRIDILVNNAGIELKVEPGQSRYEEFFDSQEPEEYLEFFRVHSLGHYLMNLAVLPAMKEQGFGRVVNVASVLGLDGSYGVPGYTASKAGAITQTKAFARRYGRHGITYNAILPGLVDTPMKDDSLPEEFEIVKSITPLGRIAQPVDIARAVLFFAQQDLFVTGQSLIVSGGGNIY
jgi:NAD(P)-dependent dehydrogenase (short-subunit alcohol dehydrogenase family)